MRTIWVLLSATAAALAALVTLAGCDAGGGAPRGRAAHRETAATGPTARVQTARRRRARILAGEPLLSVPGIGTVRWRYTARGRFVTILDIPDGGATEAVRITAGGRLRRLGNLQPGQRAVSRPVREGPVAVRVVQSTEPATVVATIHVVYERGRNVSAAAPLVTSRIETRDHAVPPGG
jgi:hypothetical protein